MRKTVTEKILGAHIKEGTLEKGQEIGIKIDMTLTQDATGTMAYLQFEALGIPKVKTELSVSFVDHNTLQTDFMNADDHSYLRTVAAKHGIVFSRPGNGICHQVYLERFSFPGKTLLGSDSHTPTAGGVGMLAIGAGGLDIAVAMAGDLFFLKTPLVVGVRLSGRLQPMCSAKDVILELLRRVDVKGGKGKVFEYFGDGVKTLSVPERATITNMGTETGSTTSIFPADEVTEEFFKKQNREKDFVRLVADDDAEYDEIIDINLSEIVPLAAMPHSPGKVGKISDLEGMKVDQVAIGSCTNSSYKDLMTVAKILKGKTIAKTLSLVISPGSKQVYEMIAENGALGDLIASGARILESACGPCIGMGQAPPTGSVTVRTFNRNFEGRCGTKDGQAYLVSPETAAACALSGVFSDPRKLETKTDFKEPEEYLVNDNMLIFPKDGEDVVVIKGPNIKPLPLKQALENSINAEVLLKVGDNISTDHIMPAGAKILPLRSNIPEISKHVFEQVDPEFPKRALEKKGGIIVGGENYGQGSSREHAALAPMYLGVKAVVVKTFARIHEANLINFGILPLVFSSPQDYEKVKQGNIVEIPDIRSKLEKGVKEIDLKIGKEVIRLSHNLSEKDAKILIAGGKLNYVKNKNA
ncbi:MAG: aconitate hydratase [Nanoarchaeota archaeon]|nr:aconitate hydratase [Nanoarchaeota archaeon]